MDFSTYNLGCIDDIRQLPTDKLLELKSQLTQYSVQVLCKARHYLSSGNLTDLEDMICYSPAGDSWGCNNSFILFDDWHLAGDSGDGRDIGAIVHALKEIEKVLIKRDRHKCSIDFFAYDLRTCNPEGNGESTK